MGTTIPFSLQAFLNSVTIRSRSAQVVSIGTRSLSCRLTPQAPTSASMATMSTGEMTCRTKSPNGSRPRFPTVHNPKENLCSGFGWYRPLVVMELPPQRVLSGTRLRTENGFHRRVNPAVRFVTGIQHGDTLGIRTHTSDNPPDGLA